MDEIKDLVMVGAGPSALSAAIYTAREDIDTVLYEKAVVGGLAAITDKVDNYPGFADGIEGMALAEQLQKQAEPRRQGRRSDHPTLPSRLIPSSFCASTANSIGSCCSTSFAKPLTISATASS